MSHQKVPTQRYSRLLSFLQFQEGQNAYPASFLFLNRVVFALISQIMFVA